MNICRTIVGITLAAALLAACSPDELPLLGGQPHGAGERPAPTSAAPPRAGEPPSSTPGAASRASEGAAPTPAAPLPTMAPVPTIAPALRNALEEEQQLLVELYKRVNPSVVSITTVGRHPAVGGGNVPEGDIPLGQGSGFLFDDQGHIVTNNHVVEDGDAFTVRFADGTALEARLIGRDPGSDLAVIKVDELPPNTAPLPLADSRTVEVGQTAVAIGNPFGLQNTLTTGVISGVGRTLAGPQSGQGGRFSIPNVIQTDAAINPGNSGGPLLNVRGEVIGVNTAIRSESGTFEGVGYAVPANAVARVVPALIRDGSYAHPWMGIAMYTIDPITARQLGLPVRQGVLVTSVQPGSPAERAGLRAGQQSAQAGGRTLAPDGDIIIAIEGQPVRTSDDLISYLELETSVGQRVTLTVVRDGAEQAVPLVLGSRPGT
jgi:2-alkenal reductase